MQPHPPGLSFLDHDTRLGAYVLVTRDDQVLLVRVNDGTDRWAIPGGGVDLYEDAREGAIREVFEETGLHIELLRLLEITSNVIEPKDRKITKSDRPLKRINVFFLGRVIGGDLRAEQGGTTNDARWFRRAEVEGLTLADVAPTGLRLLLSAF